MTRRITGSRPDATDDDGPAVEGGSEREEVGKPGARPNLLMSSKPRGSLPRQMVRGPALRSDQEKVQAREMLARRRRASLNEFYNSGDELALPTPPDDEAYHYGWVRHSVNGRSDVANLRSRLHGRLPWEPVPLNELPQDWQAQLVMTQAKDGNFAGFAAIEDLVLMRCSREAYIKAREAEQLHADDLVLGAKAQWEELLDRQGLRPQHDAFEVDELLQETAL